MWHVFSVGPTGAMELAYEGKNLDEARQAKDRLIESSPHHFLVVYKNGWKVLYRHTRAWLASQA